MMAQFRKMNLTRAGCLGMCHASYENALHYLNEPLENVYSTKGVLHHLNNAHRNANTAKTVLMADDKLMNGEAAFLNYLRIMRHIAKVGYDAYHLEERFSEIELYLGHLNGKGETEDDKEMKGIMGSVEKVKKEEKKFENIANGTISDLKKYTIFAKNYFAALKNMIKTKDTPFRYEELETYDKAYRESLQF